MVLWTLAALHLADFAEIQDESLVSQSDLVV